MKTIWRLKKGSDIRLRSRHPWVFSNELSHTPKGILPGDPVEIQDVKGHFIARGFGNPISLIAFRALSFDSQKELPHSEEAIVEKICSAWARRIKLGFTRTFRVCFSEADFLPGLIIDRYYLRYKEKIYQCLSLQFLTAGIDKIFKSNPEILFKCVEQMAEKNLNQISWENTIVLIKNNSKSRKLEGLELQPAVLVKNIDGLSLDLSDVIVELEQLDENSVKNNISVRLNCDLLEGQKTGLFLDQSNNIQLLFQVLRNQLKFNQTRHYRILDLCCYMGQWSTYLASFLLAAGHSVEIDLVDISELALRKAEQNLKSLMPILDEKKRLVMRVHKLDILEIKDEFANGSFDIVISDPPAFVKNKKSIETGLHGYMKLNEKAFKLASSDSIVVSCSCSGLVSESDFKSALRKSLLRSGRTAQIIAQGSQGADHPKILSFPDGDYLKMLVHRTD